MIIFIVLVVAVYLVYFSFQDFTYVESSDKNEYLIRRNPQFTSVAYLKDSANTLSEINKRVIVLIQHLVSKYKDDPEHNYYINVLAKNYKPSILSEAAIDKRYTTFTINKESIHICLRTRDNNQQLYDMNTLMYVILHELAHFCNYDKNMNAIHGHGEEFKRVFKLMVEEAIEAGVYKYINYSVRPQEYCGIMINSSIV
jgi:hypothetical protein